MKTPSFMRERENPDHQAHRRYQEKANLTADKR
jgi:hypothetical protein